MTGTTATAAATVPDNLSSILSTETVPTPQFRWIGLKKLIWKDPTGKSREWECAFRTTRKSECDGVAVIAFVKYPSSNKEEEVLLVTQFRPPVGAEMVENINAVDVSGESKFDSTVVEAPAGLVDAGEDAAIAAERELLEETGYTGKVTCVSPIVPCDPGMTDANMRYVTIEVDGDAIENRNAKARPDDGEFITIRRLPASRLQEGLDSMGEAGFQVDARLYAMAAGYALGKAAAATESTKTRAVTTMPSVGAGAVALGCVLLAVAVGGIVAGSMCPGKGMSGRGAR